MRSIRRNLLLHVAALGIAGSALAGSVIADDGNAAERAREIIERSGVDGGLIVHIGSDDGELTAALRLDERYRVLGLETDAESIATARERARSRDLYGEVTIERLEGSRLPLIDNLVNLVVAEDLGDVPMAEVVRVLVPEGVAYIRHGGIWARTIKPRPDDIDDWTHYLHDATGNAVAHDTAVGPPRRLQWIGSPRWSRHHDRMASLSALVSAGGKVFYIMDEGSRVSIQLPPDWKLIARDAMNGTVLWKRPLEKWHSHLWPLKSGPTQLARRLVATPDEVYVTLGLEAPLTAIDAATGEILRTYEESDSTEEVITSRGVLFLLVNRGELELSDYTPLHNVGDQGRVRNEFLWNEEPREVLAIEAESGRLLWKKSSRVAPLTLAAGPESVLYHDGAKVVCLDRENGEERWSSIPAPRRGRLPMNFGPKLVIWKDVVLFAGGDRTMRGFSLENGEELWTAPHPQSGYQSPEDLLVVNGLVWSAPTTRTGDSGTYTGRDPRTGEVKVEFSPDVETYWFHHRCHLAKATDRYLLPSRTGIEFVDLEKKSWEIHHWVRGGCLYGIMPANGLIYAPPHNCACYPETKLYGLNALAPAAKGGATESASDEARLEQGPAFGAEIPARESSPSDWPTYRHDRRRSGRTPARVEPELEPRWRVRLEGKLSAPVIAGGRLYVAAIDSHTVCALDASSGERLWSYTAGGRVDSPPTVAGGRVTFGSADGSVYSLRAEDGELIWRFRAAPRDRRLMAFEQLESVWPVHGSVLVEEDTVWAVAGRSNFLDGGLRLLRLDARTGEKLSERIIDERDPVTGENLQARLQILNMPVGLPDVLSSDGRYVYMRSQRFDAEGRREEIGPHSGNPPEQGAVQRGKGAHLFAPMGFLDDTWFHRSYWVYGRSFAGGHGGYYQAGKFAPSGRILVFDEHNVYGFGRKPEYYRWTTTLEHQLFAAPKEAPDLPAYARRGTATMVRFEKSESLDPAGKAVAVMAWVKAERPDGVVVARGGPAHGYSLFVEDGKPRFAARVSGEAFAVTGKEEVTGRWAHLAGVLRKGGELEVWIDGKLSASAKGGGLIAADPVQSLEIGADDGSGVGEYRSPFALTGLIDEVRVYHGELGPEEIAAHHGEPSGQEAGNAALVLACTFDEGDARDASGNENDGKVEGPLVVDGRRGRALRFFGRPSRSAGSFVERIWARDVPLLVRAMVLADDTLFVAGPPDLIDEEETFERLTRSDPEVDAPLAAQAAALEGSEGALLLAVSARDGETRAEHRLPSLPVWDGMAAAGGRLYLALASGEVVCLEGR